MENSNVNESPLVSICCATYNHASFIRQCLDGFVMQETNFPIEVLIHDDASTDGTADMIREYEIKYQKIIKPIYQTENQYSKGVKISTTYNFPRIKGKYIAFCEGDDYWTDPLKLQKQVDFMEANPDFSICFHPAALFEQEKNEIVANWTVRDVPSVTDIKVLAEGNYINTCSVLYRKNQQVLDDYKNYKSPGVGDYYLHMRHAEHGKIKKLPDTMSVYRIHKGGIWSLKPIEYTHPRWLKLLVLLQVHFKDDKEICSIIETQYEYFMDNFKGSFAWHTKQVKNQQEHIDHQNSEITKQQAHIDHQNSEMGKLRESLDWHIDYAQKQQTHIEYQDFELEKFKESINWYNEHIKNQLVHIERQQGHIEYQNLEIKNMENTIYSMRKSFSWRITGILRKIKRGISR